MSGVSVKRSEGRMRRKLRVRKKVYGTSLRPRLNVYRSLKHVYAQVIDDESGVTLAMAASTDKELKGVEEADKTACARAVGALVAERCKAKDIGQVVFDRNGYRYHGRVQAVAEAAREAGLSF
jgi:large subunit ribosomal protein L18